MLSQTAAKRKLPDSGPLDADAWIDAALAVLARDGVDAVRVEPLAKQLGVTKGSFYWHFKDRAALLDAVLATWKQRATLAVIERIQRARSQPHEQLRALIALPRRGSRARNGADIESAIRFWGRRDPKAAAAVRDIDRQRLDHICSLVEASARGSADSAARAMLIYAFILAEASIGASIDSQVRAACERILVPE
jgi:AcrR family transcriptional regulator